MRIVSSLLSILALVLLSSCEPKNSEPVDYASIDWKNDTYLLEGKPFTGKAILKHSDGSLKGEREFKKGLKHGILTDYSAEGIKISETHYKNGKREGPNTYWDPEGNLIKIQHYKDDKEVSTEYFGSLAEDQAKEENKDTPSSEPTSPAPTP